MVIRRQRSSQLEVRSCVAARVSTPADDHNNDHDDDTNPITGRLSTPLTRHTTSWCSTNSRCLAPINYNAWPTSKRSTCRLVPTPITTSVVRGALHRATPQPGYTDLTFLTEPHCGALRQHAASHLFIKTKAM